MSNRSKPQYKPRFPRLRFLLLRRKVNKALDWVTLADSEGNVTVKAINHG